MAARMYVQPGTVARSLLSTAIDQVDTEATTITAILDSPLARTPAEPRARARERSGSVQHFSRFGPERPRGSTQIAVERQKRPTEPPEPDARERQRL